MYHHRARSRRRSAHILVLISLGFGLASPIWSAQAYADVQTPDITQVTQLGDTGNVWDTTTAQTDPVIVTTIPEVLVVPPLAPSIISDRRLVASATRKTTGEQGRLRFTTAAGCSPAQDFADGTLQADAKAFVQKLLSAGWSIRIVCIKEGHSTDVAGSSRKSLHSSGEAFDVDQINGHAVSPSSPTSNRFYRWLKAQANSDLPWEVGGPHVPAGRSKILGKTVQPFGPFFTNSGHQGHWHFGFKANSGSFDNPVLVRRKPTTPVSPQTPAFVMPPPQAKEEKPQPTVTVEPSNPDPQGNGNSAPNLIVPVEIPPASDTPVAPVEPPAQLAQPAPDAMQPPSSAVASSGLVVPVEIPPASDTPVAPVVPPAQPAPVAVQPTPDAVQPTPVAAQPTPVAAQPTTPAVAPSDLVTGVAPIPDATPSVAPTPSVTTAASPTATPPAPAAASPAPFPIDQAALTADFERMKADGILPIAATLETQFNLPPGSALALASRETNGHNELGDNGHGHCYLQIDDRSHGDWLATHDWHDPLQCFTYGLSILASNRDAFDGNMFDAYAAYNSGAGSVHRALRNGESAESRTAHGNYASDVMARADFFRQLLLTDGQPDSPSSIGGNS